MAASKEIRDLARDRWEWGAKVADIAEEARVDIRTVQRWAKAGGWRSRGTSLSKMSDALPKTIEAFPHRFIGDAPSRRPEEHKWPGWTLDDLSDLRDFRRDLWQSNLDLIDSQASQGQHTAGWFFKNLVELARRLDMPDGSLNWSLAIAGLPVLADWLDCPPCTDLATLIEKHRPWEGNRFSRQRGAYQREARTMSAAVRQCVDQARALIVMDDFAKKRQSPAPATVALAILAERIPMFDRAPRRSRYRSANLGGAILTILATPKGE